MPSVRKIKRQFFRRQWFSSQQTLKLDDGRVEIWPMRRHGLAYDDHRARSGIRWPSHGKHALQQVPYDDMHMDRKMWKKRAKVDSMCVNRRVRDLRSQKYFFMDRMSFHEVRSLWWQFGLGEVDEVTYLPMLQALDTKYIKKMGPEKLVHRAKAALNKVANTAYRKFREGKIPAVIEIDSIPSDFQNIWASPPSHPFVATAQKALAGG